MTFAIVKRLSVWESYNQENLMMDILFHTDKKMTEVQLPMNFLAAVFHKLSDKL